MEEIEHYGKRAGTNCPKLCHLGASPSKDIQYIQCPSLLFVFISIHYRFEESSIICLINVVKVGDDIIKPCDSVRETGYLCSRLLKGVTFTA